MQSLCERTLTALRERFHDELRDPPGRCPPDAEGEPHGGEPRVHYWTWRDGMGDTVELCLQEREAHCSVRLLSRHCEVKFLEIRTDRQLELFLSYLDENVLCTSRAQRRGRGE